MPPNWSPFRSLYYPHSWPPISSWSSTVQPSAVWGQPLKPLWWEQLFIYTCGAMLPKLRLVLFNEIFLLNISTFLVISWRLSIFEMTVALMLPSWYKNNTIHGQHYTWVGRQHIWIQHDKNGQKILSTKLSPQMLPIMSCLTLAQWDLSVVCHVSHNAQSINSG